MVSAGAGASGASDASGASPARRVLVLYGSETGNAQDVAERVVREAKLLEIFAAAEFVRDVSDEHVLRRVRVGRFGISKI